MKRTTLTPSAPSVRAEIEARRGIVRDELGRIVRSKAWRRERIEFLKLKLADCEQRSRNIKAEIKQHEAEL